ncbi:MAG: hypothetical protein ACHP84_11590 [Caulobacterales bacterium]|jgi:ElaB/YqjD/DUF883 family membrane-anchored ribosome-binding protein
MSAETTSADAAQDAQTAVKNAKAALDNGQRSFAEAMTVAERSLGDAAKRLEKVLKEGVDALKSQTEAYAPKASQQMDEAQKYLVERVKERPVTATLAGLGVGLLLGLLLANRSK